MNWYANLLHLYMLAWVLGYKRSQVGESEPDAFWWANSVLSAEHHQRCILWMVKERTASMKQTSPNNKGAVANGDTKTFTRQLPITLIFMRDFSIPLPSHHSHTSNLYMSLASFRWQYSEAKVPHGSKFHALKNYTLCMNQNSTAECCTQRAGLTISAVKSGKWLTIATFTLCTLWSKRLWSLWPFIQYRFNCRVTHTQFASNLTPHLCSLPIA